MSWPPRRSEFLHSRTHEESLAAIMLQHNSLHIPYKTSVPVERDRWRCTLEPRMQFESEEEANEHVLRKGRTHQVQRMIYELDFQLFPPKSIYLEIEGAGSASKDNLARDAFLLKKGWFGIHFSNETIEKRPEEFVQYMRLLKIVLASGIHPSVSDLV